MTKVILALVVSIIGFCLIATAQQELKCDSPEHRQLDFWIGDWDVIDQTTGKQAGTSKIEKLLDGCVIYESWTGVNQYRGNSFNLYNRDVKKWQQVWVDTSGQRIDFVGELKSDGMYYEGPFRSNGKEVMSRMKFIKLPDNRVRQLWEQSQDGKIWKVLFDGLYVKKSK